MSAAELSVVLFVGVLFTMGWQAATVLIRAWQGRAA